MRSIIGMNPTPHTLAAAVIAAAFSGCVATHHATVPASIGVPSDVERMVALLSTPGPVVLESVDSAQWSVPLSGLLNLNHPTAKAAHLEDKAEPIVVPVHVLRHPDHGTFIIDTGVEEGLKTPSQSAVRGVVNTFFDLEKTMHVERSLKTVLAAESAPLAGVFLTHIHLDHVMGLPDVPRGTPIYAGPGETSPTSLENALVASAYDRLFEGQAPLQEWRFDVAAADNAAGFKGIVDIFGDGSVFALWVPGHTPGSTAYLVRSTTGPVLLTGDASHTRWGWDHDVEPGTYTADAVAGRHSFDALRAFAAAHTDIEVRVGHQR
jgi:glyoxylase-like metal-dependent hydrolase (beta-lactamase superfamily II)